MYAHDQARATPRLACAVYSPLHPTIRTRRKRSGMLFFPGKQAQSWSRRVPHSSVQHHVRLAVQLSCVLMESWPGHLCAPNDTACKEGAGAGAATTTEQQVRSGGASGRGSRAVGSPSCPNGNARSEAASGCSGLPSTATTPASRRTTASPLRAMHPFKLAASSRNSASALAGLRVTLAPTMLRADQTGA
jgi:hypothetical protein